MFIYQKVYIYNIHILYSQSCLILITGDVRPRSPPRQTVADGPAAARHGRAAPCEEDVANQTN